MAAGGPRGVSRHAGPSPNPYLDPVASGRRRSIAEAMKTADVDDAQLEAAYLVERLSLREIGARYGLSGGGTRKRLLRRGVELRSQGEGARIASDRQLERYKAERGLLDAGDVALAVDCSRVTVDRHAARGELTAERYAGDGWHAKRGTWLFEPIAVDQLRGIIADGQRHHAQAIDEARRAGRLRRPRTGAIVTCLHCGQAHYRHPYLLDRVRFCSRRCWGRYRLERGIHPLQRKAFAEHWSADSRARWGRLWGGKSRRRRRGGKDSELEVRDDDRIAQLVGQGLRASAIAYRLGISEKQVYRSPAWRGRQNSR
jgi:hypothetical protein